MGWLVLAGLLNLTNTDNIQFGVAHGMKEMEQGGKTLQSGFDVALFRMMRLGQFGGLRLAYEEGGLTAVAAENPFLGTGYHLSHLAKLRLSASDGLDTKL